MKRRHRPAGTAVRLLPLAIAGLLSACGSEESPHPAAGVRPSAPDAPQVRTAYDVVLTAVGSSQIQVIKAIREVTGLGLKDAKDIADSVPRTVKAGVSRDDAERAARVLRDAGAQVEIR